MSEPLTAQFQVICTEAVRAALEADARRFGVSMAVLIRESVEIGYPTVRETYEAVAQVRERLARERVA